MSKPLFKVNVSAIIKNSSGEILMIQRSLSEDIFPGYWGIPGGTVDPTDSSLEATLRRECLEEVGIEITNIALLSNDIADKGNNTGALYLVYTAEHASGEPIPDDGTEKVEWLGIDAIRKLKLTPMTLELIERCL